MREKRELLIVRMQRQMASESNGLLMAEAAPSDTEGASGSVAGNNQPTNQPTDQPANPDILMFLKGFSDGSYIPAAPEFPKVL